MEIEPHSPWTSSTILSLFSCDSSLFGLEAIPLAPRLLGKVILIFKCTIIKFTHIMSFVQSSFFSG